MPLALTRSVRWRTLRAAPIHANFHTDMMNRRTPGLIVNLTEET